MYGLVADCFDKLTFDIRQNVEDDRENEKKNKRLMSIIKYVEDHYQEEHILEKMSRDLGLSEKSIHRQLKMGIGLSAKELVTEYRVKEAKRMLKYTNKPISMIADTVGFNSDKTFYRVFKKQLGITPKEYRKAGERINADDEIKGYLGMNWRESMNLLQKYLKEYETGEMF